MRIRSLFCLFTVFVLLLGCVPVSGEEEEIVEEVWLDDEEEPEETPAEEPGDVFTPSHGSPYTKDIGSAYWTTPMDITDEAAVWDMLMQPITVVDLGKIKGKSRSQLTKTQTYLYSEPDESSKILGEVTNLSQGVRVIEHLDNGWSLVECYSSSFFSKPATKTEAWNLLVSGYLPTKYLKQVEPTKRLALVIDKLTQRLYVFQEGKMIATLLCSTGLVQWNGSKYQPYNETRSGEFLLINMTGQLTSDRLVCSYAIRFNGGDEVHEVPHQTNRDGSYNYKSTEPKLGTKCSHGCIRVQRLTTPEGINMAPTRTRPCTGTRTADPITTAKTTALTARGSPSPPSPTPSWTNRPTAAWSPARTALPSAAWRRSGRSTNCTPPAATTRNS